VAGIKSVFKVIGVFVLCLCAVAGAAPAQHSISGYVQTGAGIGVEGVDVIGDNGAGSAVTGADGSYSVTVPNNWRGSIAVSKGGWLITPASRAYDKVRVDIINDNYIAYQPKISGYVTNSNGTGVAGVMISANNGGGSDTTDINGFYEIIVPYSWSGTVTPSKTDWGFIPASQVYSNVTSDETNQDYITFQPKISGYVKDNGDTEVEGVSISADNGGGSDTTDINGYYEIVVPYDWSGTVTANKIGWNLTPSSRPYSNVTSDQPNQDYTAFQPKISGYVRDANGIGVENVLVSANNGGGSDTTDATGFYKITVPYSWSGSVTAKKIKWTITPPSYSYSNLTTDIDGQDYLADYIGVIIVKPDGTGDFPTIQDAIDATVNGDTVELQSGTYTGDGNRDIDFKGKAITVRGATGNPNDVIIDCQGDVNNPHRGFEFVSGEDANSILESLTITNGYAPEEAFGGLLFSAGGAIYCDWGGPIIRNCIISNNYAYKGGGIHIGWFTYVKKSITVSNCIIRNNSASAGGGIYNDGYSNPNISNCIISNNSALAGGGIHNWYHTRTNISNCIISNNLALGGSGGGIFSSNECSVIIKNSQISNNSASFSGGGTYNFANGRQTLYNCIISDNSAGTDGGGFYNLHYSSLNIYNCTIANNSVITERGGGICNDSSNADITNSIIWGNNGFQLYGSGYTVDYSNIQGGHDGIGNINTDPCFINDYHISLISQCTNAGDPDYIPEPNETDIDGDPRIVYKLDMGADEVLVHDSAALFVSQEEIDLLLEGKDGIAVSEILEIYNCGAYELNWHIEKDCNWLIVQPSSGQTQSLGITELSISIDHNYIDYGISSCQFQVIDPNALNSPQTVTVNLEVLRPAITVSPTNFDFEGEKDGNDPNTQILSIQNTGYDTLNWQIEVPPDCNWLNVEPTSGQSTGETNEVTLSVDVTTLDIGFYNCELIVSDPNAGNSPQVIPVELRVLEVKGQRHVPTEYDTIQAAINAAVDGDEVIIQPGRYTGPGNYDIDFLGKAITVRSIDPNDSNIVADTVVDCNYQGRGFRILGGPNSILDGLTIKNSNHEGVYLGDSSVISRCVIINSSGSGIHSSGRFGRNPFITECTIHNNHYVGINMYGGLTVDKCVITNNSHGGIRAYSKYGEGAFVITDCLIRGNYANTGAGIMLHSSSPTNAVIKNCLITGNLAHYDGGGIFLDIRGNNMMIENCTISGNKAMEGGGGGIFIDDNVEVKNCILWDNDANDGPEIVVDGFGSIATISYSDVQGGQSAVYVDPCSTLNWGGGNIDIDPCFTEPGYWHPNDTPLNANDDFWVRGDYHLKSEAGRWEWSKYIGLDPTGDGFIDLSDFAAFTNSWQTKGGFIPADLDRSGFVDLSDLKLLLDSYLADYPVGEWILDDVTSPCIDAGDPNSDWTAELWQHGKRVNMGAYGGTPEASMSLSTVGNKADLNNDGFVNAEDLALFVDMWLAEDVLLSEDINRNGLVNFSDWAEFADQWR
jgi:hypothetical protein